MENTRKESSDKGNEDDKTRQHVPDTVVIHEAVFEEDVPSSSMAAIKSPVPKDNLYYNMSLKYRGNCIIFNHETFLPEIGTKREGTDIDAALIEATFSKLGFNVTTHKDLKLSEIDGVVSDLSKIDYTDHSCLCIFVLTHGDSSGKLYASNSGYPLEYLWKSFTADECRTLSGKPKLFFIQACRGGKVDRGIPMCSRMIMQSQGAPATFYKLPVNADFLIAYSTFEGYVSWRDPANGSTYIETLCNVINTHWTTTDLVKMLTMTSRIIATSYISKNSDSNMDGLVQMPTFSSTLTRDLVFTSMDK